MKMFQYLSVLVIIGIAILSSCRLTGYAEEEKKLAKDICLVSSSAYLQRKETGYSYPYSKDRDLLAIAYFCIVRPEEIDARGY